VKRVMAAVAALLISVMPMTVLADEPLPVRPTKPLQLAPESTGTPIAYKLAFFALVAAGGFFWWQKRKKTVAPAGASPAATLRVVARASAGFRTELAVVDVGSMRVLVGVTPNNITTLAILPDEIPSAADEPSKAESIDLAARARALFAHPAAARDEDLSELAPTAIRRRAPKQATREDGPPAVEEQALGLVRALKGKR